MSWILRILRPFSRITQSKVPATTYTTLELDPASFELTDDPANERQILSVTGAVADGSPIIVGSVAEARALSSAGWVNGREVRIASTYSAGPYTVVQWTVYVWNSALTLADDGAISIKPSDVSGAGRLLRGFIYRTGEVYSGSGQGLSVYAGTTPPGAPSSGTLRLDALSRVLVYANGNSAISFDGTNLGVFNSTGSPQRTLTASRSDQQAQIDELIVALVRFGFVVDNRTP